MRDLRDRHLDRTGDYFDWPLFIATMIVMVIGEVNLYSATSVYQKSRADLYVSQLYFLVAGGVIATFMFVVDYRHFERWAYFLYGFGVLTLGLVFVLGKDIRGSSRWINVGGFGFQPSEFMKIWLALALAKYFHEAPRSDQPKTLRELWIPAAMTIVPFFLILRQPDLGTALIVGLVGFSITALNRVRWRSIAALVGTIGVALPIAYSNLQGYQLKRIETFLNPESDVTGAGYHAHHARIAIGNGGVFGQGYMKGSQNQYYFLPDQYTDFPFPVMAEDWGFVGSVVLILVYAFIVLWGIRIAALSRDRFGAVAAIGVSGMIFWHAFFNLGMVTGVLPVVGVTLPLFSYGGSSVITILMGLGLLLNISGRRPHIAPLRTERMTFAR